VPWGKRLTAYRCARGLLKSGTGREGSEDGRRWDRTTEDRRKLQHGKTESRNPVNTKSAARGTTSRASHGQADGVRLVLSNKLFSRPKLLTPQRRARTQRGKTAAESILCVLPSDWVSAVQKGSALPIRRGRTFAAADTVRLTAFGGRGKEVRQRGKLCSSNGHSAPHRLPGAQVIRP